MNSRFLFLLLAALLPLACVTAPPDGGPGSEARPEIDALMEHWIASLKSENPDAMLEAYWPEAEVVIIQPDGREMVLRGHEEIFRRNAEGFRQQDVFRELRFSQPEREFRGDSVAYHYRVEAPRMVFTEHFEFRRIEGRWQIVHQVIDTRPPEAREGAAEAPAELREAPRVASEFQAWADENRNGTLEPPELERFLEAVRALVREPHPVQSPADEFFDLDRNGQIGPEEMHRARLVLFQEQPRRLYQFSPEIARGLDTFDNDETIRVWEAREIFDRLFFPELRQPREARDPLDRKFDRNKDGRLDQEEIELFTRRAFSVCALLPLERVEAPSGAPGKTDIFKYVDLNDNGTLEPIEIEDLGVIAFWTLGIPGHPVRTPLDEYFDWNRDGRVDAGEIERARGELVELPLREMYRINPELAGKVIDLNGDRRIEDEEIGAILQLLFGVPRYWEHRETYEAPEPLVRRLDENRNGRIDYPEYERFYEGTLLRVALRAWLEVPDAERERMAVESYLQELADTNGDGFVDPEEETAARESLQGPHPVRSDFDRRIDLDRDGQISELEIMKARRAGDIREAAAEAAQREFPASTPIDRYIDLNNDGRVTAPEIQAILAVLREPGSAALPGRWRELLDLDGNGTVSRDEVQAAWEMYLRPHPVNPDFRLDSRLDVNKNGFVEPQEIGIAAGFAAGQPIPSFDERLEQLGFREERFAQASGTPAEQKRFESEYYRKLGTIQDRKLAVVGLSSGTKNVDDETASGVMVFIENAFVNVGKVRVVDRQNIAKVVAEYEFQQSDLTDETTAVKIGKLSGADIIVIGSISFVGKQYYLNIKLINVETGEIIGSSIADAAEATQFYEMCNEAVYKLF